YPRRPLPERGRASRLVQAWRAFTGLDIGCSLRLMAESASAVLCTSCGARNKAKWEFCARCGEPLVDATAETLVPRSARAPSAAPDTDEVLLGPDVSPWNGPIAFVILVALTGVIAACWRTAKEGVPPVEAKPGVLTLATLPPTPPPAVATTANGEEAFPKGNHL